jgi:hypothetical protein
VKKFLAVVVGVVALGLAIRFTLNRPKQGTARPPVKVERVQPQPSTNETQRPHEPQPEAMPVPMPVPEPQKPEPPRIAGSVQISDARTSHFAAANGVIYYCEGGSVIAQPKDGGAPKRVGDCNGAFDFVADAQGAFYCDSDSESDSHRLMRITAGTDESHLVTDAECIVSALDGKYAYFVVPGFEGVEDPGVYRVAREGGKPEKIHATRPKEQFMLAVDDEALWIGAWSAGTISKLAKTPGAKPKLVVTGQKGIVDLALDGTYVWWYSEGTTEVRRRKKSGGKTEVVGHDVDQEPVIVVSGHAYWFEGPAGEDKRLMHMPPGAQKAEQLATGLKTPSMRADSEGVYVSELDRPGIFMFKR